MAKHFRIINLVSIKIFYNNNKLLYFVTEFNSHKNTKLISCKFFK